MRLVMLRSRIVIFLIVGAVLFVGCKRQDIFDTSTCPPPEENTSNNSVKGQGWITSISSDANGKWLITIDLDEYEGDPSSATKFHKGEGERRIGLPDVTIVELPSTIDWSVDSPIFFSGMTKSGFSTSEYQEQLLVPSDTSIICHPSAPSQRKITLTVPFCCMDCESCYTYGYTIFESGVVIFTEREWGTGETITKTGQMSKTEFQKLVNAFEQINYFSFQDDYDEEEWTDMGSLTTSITLEYQRKSIFHYYGDTSAPKELTDLERELQEAVNNIQYK